MTYSELVQFYFDRSTSLQLYWTIYVVIVGGLLAFSSMRERADLVSTVLVSILFIVFAYKNLGAIEDVTNERLGIWLSIREFQIPEDAVETKRLRDRLEPNLMPSLVEDVWNTHVASDILTLAAVWAMEMRRRRWQIARSVPSPSSPPAA